MRHYEGEDDAQKQELEHFFEEEDEQGRYIDMMQAGLMSKDVDQKLMDISLRIVEKSFFWRFRSTNSKLKKVLEVYYTLNHILESEVETEE